MAETLASKIRRAPRWMLKMLAAGIAEIPLVADAACPSFSPIPSEFLRPRGYASQIGQDFVIDQVLYGGVERGIFVDVGAHDGVDLSNTYFLETVRGWNGLCVEPNPAVFARLAENRKCAVEQVALGATTGTVDFTVISGPDMLSGVTSNLNRRHRRRIKQEIHAVAGHQEVIRVPLRRLQSLLDQHGLLRVDLLTVDTEGSELAVLQGIDFGKTRISVIVIERNYESGAIPRYLRRRGFVRLMALGWDDIYLRDDLLLAREVSHPAPGVSVRSAATRSASATFLSDR